MKYGHPTLLRYPLWVSLESDKDVKFLIKPLSYSKVYGLNEYYYIKDKLDGVEKYTPYDSLEDSIVEVKGIIGFSNTKEVLQALSSEDRNYLEYKLYQLSSLTSEQLGNIQKLIYLVTEPKLQEPTYSCDKCKSIPGLQAARNCPLLDAEPTAKFKLRVGDTTYTRCPIASMDTYIVNQIIQSNNFLSMNTLPLSGGIEEQSAWFVLVSQRYKARLNELRALQNQS